MLKFGWSTTRSAIGELLVIVIGVLIALSLESWWADQQDRWRESDYLAALREEARANVEEIRGLMKITDLKRTALEGAEAFLANDQHTENAALFLENLLQGSGILVTPSLSQAVFEDLRSSGRLSLILDDNTRRRIIRHYAQIDAMLIRQQRWEEIINPGLHALASRHVPPGTSEQVGPRIRIHDRGNDSVALREAVEDLVGSDKLLREMSAARRALEAERAILSFLADFLGQHLNWMESLEETSQ